MIFRTFGSADVRLPVIGQGTWGIGEKPAHEKEEIRALRLGFDLGMTHIDTAEMYGGGRTERLVGRAIAGIRDQVFLTSKVLPSNASYRGTIRACEQSLARLGTDRLDCYLLHWWSGRHPIEETMRAMEKLVEDAKTRFVGVSNLDVEELNRALDACSRIPIVCDQVCYHLQARGIEHSLVPHCEQRKVAVVAYSPFGSGNFPIPESHQIRQLEEIGLRHGRTARQVALNFLTRRDSLFAIPKAGNPQHVRENAGAVGWELSTEDFQAIDRIFPPPAGTTPLTII